MPIRLRCFASLLPLALAALAFVGSPAAAWDDPLLPMLRRTDRYLQEHQVGGVTMDWRYTVIPSEEIRQTVVCQLLAYVELARLDSRPRLRVEIARHADFLLGHLVEIRSYTPFDGMLAYALLGAYEITREARFLEAGTAMTDDLLAIPTSQCVLNGGLMVAMATAEYAQLTGSAEATQKTHDIVAQLAPYQNADGSFPHWCWGSRDIHYTGWMGMEMMHIRRMSDEPLIEQFLPGMTDFLERRVGPTGRSVYEEPCPGEPGCMQYFYSRATGCDFDLDSRGWTVEPAYMALLFDHFGSPKYLPVMTFLDSLEEGGTVSDLFDYWPPPSDPEYPWTTADTSVVCMSINLWVLATAVADRVERGVPIALVLDDVIGTISAPPGADPTASRIAIAPNPCARGCTVRFTQERAGPGSVAIHDANGRLVRRLESGRLAGGTHEVRWDGCNEAGRRCPAGIYFVRLQRGDRSETRHVVVVR